RDRHVVAFAQVNGERREPLFVSDVTVKILKLSDGTRTALEIAAEIDPADGPAGDRRGIERVEGLFFAGVFLFLRAAVLSGPGNSNSHLMIRYRSIGSRALFRAHSSVSRFPFLRPTVSLFTQARRRYIDVCCFNSQKVQNASDGCRDVLDKFLIAKLQRHD